MATRTRRAEALTRERIVGTAVELLDTAGEAGLTFRTLTERLATGPGAVYWHVANKDELLAAATDSVVGAALAAEPTGSSPADRIRAVALGLFNAIEEHPWVAAQLAASSWQVTAPRILESVGRQVRALGVPRASWFTVSTVLVQYMLGGAGQNAANVRAVTPGADRDDLLDAVAVRWRALDPDDWSFTRSVADQMRSHDDREQFLAGIDVVLAGITAVHRSGEPES